MKSEEFLAEALKSPECPADFEEQFNYFRKYQRMVLDTLREFHRICEKNGINYHVTYGSLIGIIRDGGQIPWDYDIDTFVPVSQKKELIEALRRDLSPDYYAMCPELDETCRHYVIRVCPKAHNSAAVHLDVFYYCGAPEDEKTRKKFNRALRLCSQIRFSKKVNIQEESVGKPARMLKLIAAKIGFSIFSAKGTDKKYERLIYQYPVDSSKYVVSADFFANWYLIPTKMLTETILYTSDIGEFRIPKDYDGFLRMAYGNYMEYPPLESRIKQVMGASRRFRHFEGTNK